MRVVTLGDTFYFAFASRAFADGVPEALGGTPDLSCIELDGTNAVIDTGATVAAHGSLTAVNIGTVVATSGNGYEAGKTYAVVIDTGTVDSVSAVGEVVYEFRIKSESEAAADLLREYAYPTGALTTQTGVSDNTGMNLTGIVDAQSQDDLFNGWWGILRDATDGQFYAFKITDFANTNLLAVIEAFDAGVTLPTPASGDNVWLMGIDPTTGSGAFAASIADAVLDEALSGHTTAGTLGKAIADIEADTNELQSDNVPGLISGLNDPTAAAVADAVLDEALSGHTTAGTLGKAIADIEADTNELQSDDVPGLISGLNDPTAASIADAVLDEALSGHTTAGTLGKAIADAESDIGGVKTKTDQLTFSSAGFVDSNVMEVNDNGGLTGDGGTTPIDQA